MSWTEGPICTVSGGTLTEVLRSVLASLRAPHLPDMPPLYAGMVGAVGFDALRPAGSTAPLDAVLVFPRSIVVFDHFRQRLRLVMNVLVNPSVSAEVQYADAVRRLDELAVRVAGAHQSAVIPVPAGVPDVDLDSDMTDADYRALLSAAHDRVLTGEVQQVTISRRYRAPTEVEPLSVYRMLRIANPSPYMFLLRLPGTTLVGSSPQGLVSVRDRQVITWAIAGTRPRGEDVETDAELAAELANDDKERAEHEMLVALARADIHAVAEPGSVHVTDRARIVRYAKVMHMVTEVTATLAADHDPLDALVAVFPSGTVSGTPREAALRIVEELEPQPRGLYGGAVGYLDFSGNLDTCIAIRALHLVDGMAYGQAGAGVIAGSDPELEVLESRAKAHAMFASLVMATALEG